MCGSIGEKRCWLALLFLVLSLFTACENHRTGSIQNDDMVMAVSVQDTPPAVLDNKTDVFDREQGDAYPAEATLEGMSPAISTLPEESLIPVSLEIISSKNVARIQPVATLFVPQVYWTQFSPDSRKLATIAQKAEDRSWMVQVWDLNSGLALYTVKGGPAIFFSTDGSSLATAAIGQGFYLWRAAAGNNVGFIESPNALALSTDWSSIVSYTSYDSGADSSVLSVIKGTSGSDRYELDVAGTVVATSFSPNGRYLAITSGGLSSESNLFDALTGERLAQQKMLDRLVFSPDSRQMAATTGSEREIWLFESGDFSPRLSLDNSAGPQPQFLAFSAEGHILAAAFGSGLRFWDTVTGENLLTLTAQTSNVLFSPDARLMVTSNFQGEVLLWGVVE